MMKKMMFTLMTTLTLFVLGGIDGVGQDTWLKILGCTKDRPYASDYMLGITTAKDSCLVMLVNSTSNDGDFGTLMNGRGGVSVICKLDQSGNFIWKRSFKGSLGNFVQLFYDRTDGGFLILSQVSFDFNRLHRIHGVPSLDDAKGESNFFVLKLDSSANQKWYKVLGGSGGEYSLLGDIAPNGDCILSGYTTSTDGDFAGMNKGEADVFVLRLDSLGNVTWKKIFGGSKFENPGTLSFDGSDIRLTGWTVSRDGDFKRPASRGYSDSFLIVLDSLGNIKAKSIGTNANHNKAPCGSQDGQLCLKLPDGHVELGTISSDQQMFDISVTKYDLKMHKRWSRIFSGSGNDVGTAIAVTSSGGIILAGHTESNDGYFQDMNKGSSDILVVSLDSNGNTIWKRTYGGRGSEGASHAQVTRDGGILIVGYTTSDIGDEYNDGDFAGLNQRGTNIFLMRIDKDGNLHTRGK